MSIQNNSNSSVFSYLTDYRFVRTTTQAVTQNRLSQAIGSVYSKATDCLLGKALVDAVKENIFEFGGYYSVATAVSPLTSRITSALMRQTGWFVGQGVSLAAGATTAIYTSRNSKNQDFSHMVKVAALTTGTTLSLIYFLPETLAEVGAAMGTEVGSYIGTLAGGIIGGYAAIKYVGSQEILWDKDNISRTYMIKTIQCVVSMSILDLIRNPSGGITQMVVDQMLGSLIYNALDITDVVQAVINKRGMDNLLPSQLGTEFLLHEDTLRSVASDKLNEVTTDALINQVKAEYYLANQIEEQLQEILISKGSPLEELTLSFLKETISPLLQSLLIKKKNEVIASHLLEIFSPLINQGLKIEETQIALLKKSTDQLMQISIKAINQYLRILLNDTGIQQAQINFDQAVSQYLKAKDTNTQAQAQKNLEKCQLNLYSIINQYFEKAILSGDLKLLLLESYKVFSEYPNSIEANKNVILKNNFNINPDTFTKEFLRTIAQKELNDSSEAMINFGEIITEQIRTLEKKAIHFPLTSNDQMFYIQQSLIVHAPFIQKLTLLNALQISKKLTDQEMKEFYGNLNTLIWGHYSSILGVKLSKKLGNIVKDQIASSTLK